MATSRSEPTSEEVAAIVAAVEAVWPRPAPPDDGRAKRPAWRFSGRWWAPGHGVAAERRRP